jgi:hypothetical protein
VGRDSFSLGRTFGNIRLSALNARK